MTSSPLGLPVGDDAAATAAEVAEVEPVLRRVVAARVQNPADVDDLVQDALVRLLAARGRLAPDAVLPYAVVTTRNLVVSHARSTERAGARRWVADGGRPVEPDEMVVRDEERRAMRQALAQIPDAERQHLLAHELDEVPPGALTSAGSSSSSVRVRLARSRAKLRVEYLLALRKIELPTPRCRPVLIALSGGDVARQSAARAGEHLLACPTCGALSEPLTQRRRGLAGFVPLAPIALLRWCGRAVRTHLVATTAVATVGVAAAVGVVAPAGRSSRPALPQPTSPAPAVANTQPQVIDRLVVQGHAATIGPGGSLIALAGQTVAANAIAVQSALTHNGFWVGSDGMHRIWVQLIGPLRDLKVVTGAHVSFTGKAVMNSASYPTDAGVAGSDALMLGIQAVHLEVVTSEISVAP